MLDEIKVKKLLRTSLFQYIDSLESSNLYFVEYEAKCKAYMEVLDDKDLLSRYEFLHIDNAKKFFKELDEELNVND